MNRSPSLGSPAAPAPPPPSPAALRRWVAALCIIRFDLERGQTVEELYPPDALPPDQQLLVAFSSFPDSMSHHHPRHRSSIHDSIFSFRFPSPSSADTGFLYGYVFNRQRHDDRLPRGGEQKSVVALSPYPYSTVFRPLLQILGPLCFDLGPSALRLVASHVANWPPPVPGRLSNLPIGGAALAAHIPPDPSSPFSFPPTSSNTPLGLYHDADLFGAFRGLLLHLWTLWEMMLLGEPILVIAPSPPQCSEAVVGLVSLIAPLHCSVDFRPYFTIHDPDFQRINSLPEGAPFPPMLLGVTNLFFLKSLRAVPHVVSVGSPTPKSSPPGNKFSPNSLINAIKLRREGRLSLMTEHKEAVWSTYTATMKPDTAVLNRLVDAGASPRIEESMSVVNNEILRRHFLELTTNFLAPFGPYLRPTTPLEGSSPYTDPPPLPAFQVDEFLTGLAARGPGKFLSKRMRSNWLGLYRRFLQGQNFMPWFQMRRTAAEKEQHRLWRQARMNTGIGELISRMNELEIVDSFNAIERHLLAEMQQPGGASEDTEATCHKLKGDLQAVFNVLPKDMQQLLLGNPKRATLLQDNLETVKFPGHPSVQGSLASETLLSFSPL